VHDIKAYGGVEIQLHNVRGSMVSLCASCFYHFRKSFCYPLNRRLGEVYGEHILK
jgi:hypothetical protein